MADPAATINMNKTSTWRVGGGLIIISLLNSAHPEMANLPDIGVARKI
jgi:hypothetical protein